MYTYDTVSEAVNGLKKRGFTSDYNLSAEGLVCPGLSEPLKASEFEIAEVYRFEGDSNPDDEAVVYAIKSKHGQDGVLVNGFGVSADPLNDDLLKKLSVHP